MKDISEINDLMVELLEAGVDMECAKFSPRGREIVNEIADYAEKTRIFQDNKERGTMFDGATLQQVFGYMLDRIVNAPTSIHRESSIILIMPFVRQRLEVDA